MIDPTAIHRTVLDNGLTLITERIPTVRSASVGIWVKLGSRYEEPARGGIAHFIEHMLFKGTATRSARDIAIAIDSMGGQLDAFTAKESACYWAKVLDAHLDDALELLADLVLNPRFDEADLERERGVILEEIAAAEDDAEDVLYESFLADLWGEHALGKPILGTRQTVGEMDADALREYFHRVYDPANVLVAAAGSLEHKAVTAQVTRHFGELHNGEPRNAVVPPRARPHFSIRHRSELEQVHLYVGVPGPSVTDPDRYTAYLLNSVLGGSVSSRLFQSVREEHGLAYSVYSTMGTYSDAGYLWIYAGTRAASAPLAIDLILAELGDLRTNPVRDDELDRMKDQLKGSLMLGLESTSGRMSSLARQEIHFGRTFALDEIIAGIDAVNAEGVQEMARRLFDDADISLGLLARRQEADELRERYAEGVNLPGGGMLLPSDV